MIRVEFILSICILALLAAHKANSAFIKPQLPLKPVPQLPLQPFPQMPLPPNPERQLCVSQMTLVNYACGMLPFSPVSPPSPPTLDLHDNSNDNHDHGHDQGDDNHDHDHDDHGVRRNHTRGTPVEQNCCRWLRDVDDVCVCDMLVHLPLFLSKPAHNYSVIVGDACNVTFTCQGWPQA